jgi:hypothetical protein
MASEWSIPAQTLQSKIYAKFNISLKRHLDGLNKSRVIDMSYRVPEQILIKMEKNPLWIPAPRTTEGSSESVESRDSQPEFISVTREYSMDEVDTNSPSLDRADRARPVSYTLVNNQCFNLFARLLADNLHHLLVVPAGTHGHIKAAVVYN